MVKKGKTRVTITLNENLLKLLKERGNVSDYVNKCIKAYIGQTDMPNYLELEQIGVNTEDCWKELGFYD